MPKMNAQECTFPFFLIIPPGLEKVSIKEIEDLKKEFLSKNNIQANIQIVSSEKGGINLQGPLEIAALINNNLKIPSRLLLRLATFRCRDFPKLFLKLGKIKWNDWCYEIGKIQSSAANSTLFDSRKIEKTAKQAIDNFFKNNPAKKNEHKEAIHPKLFIRFQDDICTVSLDTSGERLGKRGLKVGTHISPLRENLAYACLYYFISQLKEKGCPGPYTLLDPMCGSGTFLSEAKTSHVPRDFSFNYIPLMEKVKRNSTKRFWFDSYPLDLNIKNIFGLDKDSRAISSAQLNLNKVQSFSKEIFNFTLKQEDFFVKESIFKVSDESIIVICNPPYGKRLVINEPRQLYLESFIEQAKVKFSPAYLGILFLDCSKKSEDTLYFEHGGLKVAFNIYANTKFRI